MMAEKGGWEEMTFGKKKSATSNAPRKHSTKNSRPTQKMKTNSTGDDRGNAVEGEISVNEETVDDVKPRKGRKRKASEAATNEIPHRRSVRTRKER